MPARAHLFAGPPRRSFLAARVCSCVCRPCRRRGWIISTDICLRLRLRAKWQRVGCRATSHASSTDGPCLHFLGRVRLRAVLPQPQGNKQDRLQRVHAKKTLNTREHLPPAKQPSAELPSPDAGTMGESFNIRAGAALLAFLVGLLPGQAWAFSAMFSPLPASVAGCLSQSRSALYRAPVACAGQQDARLARLFATALAGEFTNAEQAASDPNFQPVTTSYRPMPCGEDSPAPVSGGVELLPGWALYQESRTTGAERPYKSSVIHIVEEQGVLLLQSYRLHPHERDRFVGAARAGDDGPLLGLCTSMLDGRDSNCDMLIEASPCGGGVQDRIIFSGSLRTPGACVFSKGGHDTWLDANLRLTARWHKPTGDRDGGEGVEVLNFETEDRFFDVACGRQVWGSGLSFVHMERDRHRQTRQ